VNLARESGLFLSRQLQINDVLKRFFATPSALRWAELKQGFGGSAPPLSLVQSARAIVAVTGALKPLEPASRMWIAVIWRPRTRATTGIKQRILAVLLCLYGHLLPNQMKQRPALAKSCRKAGSGRCALSGKCGLACAIGRSAWSHAVNL